MNAIVGSCHGPRGGGVDIIGAGGFAAVPLFRR